VRYSSSEEGGAVDIQSGSTSTTSTGRGDRKMSILEGEEDSIVFSPILEWPRMWICTSAEVQIFTYNKRYFAKI
jgi:hypothetical protein